MGKARIIPKLQLKTSRRTNEKKVLVTTYQFDRVTEVGDPVSQAKIYEAQAADELIFLDLDQGRTGSKSVFSILESLSEEIFMPITVGGGIRTLEDIKDRLRSGADKVAINSIACEDPQFIRKAADKFGSQCIVVSIDIKKEKDRYSVWSECGKKRFTKELFAWATEVEKLGAGELLVTSIDRDGTKQGLDIKSVEPLSKLLQIPVLIGGGCGQANHFIEAFKQGKVSGVTAGTFFCFKDENPMQTRSRIRNAGIPIRIQS